ncbi:MAG: MFS transporter, partial [Tumebacillaceae bacterium]
VMQLLGYLTGGVLIQWFLGLGFLINAFTFIAAGIVSFYIGGGEPSLQDQPVKGSKGNAFRKYVGNWKLSWLAMQDSPTLRLAFWTALIINIMIIPMIALIAPLVSETSGGSGLMYSFVTSASVIGSLVGATWVRKSKIRDAYLILFGAMVCCLVGLVAGFSQIAIFLALTMLMYGLGQSIFNISESIAIQKCEPHLRASIAGIIQSTVLVGYPITMLTTARLVEVTSIRLPFVLAGVFSIVAVLICGWRWMVAEGSGKGNKNQEAEVPM